MQRALRYQVPTHPVNTGCMERLMLAGRGRLGVGPPEVRAQLIANPQDTALRADRIASIFRISSMRALSLAPASGTACGAPQRHICGILNA